MVITEERELLPRFQWPTAITSTLARWYRLLFTHFLFKSRCLARIRGWTGGSWNYTKKQHQQFTLLNYYFIQPSLHPSPTPRVRPSVHGWHPSSIDLSICLPVCLSLCWSVSLPVRRLFLYSQLFIMLDLLFVVIEELGPSEVDKVGTITPLLETPGSTTDHCYRERQQKKITLDCFAFGLILITT